MTHLVLDWLLRLAWFNLLKRVLFILVTKQVIGEIQMLFSPTVSICLRILLSFCSTRALPGRIKSVQAAVQVPSLSGTGAAQPFHSET